MLLKRIPLNLYFVLAAFFYYIIFFINRGIVIYDEGYYAHIADRILNGQVPYKDFFIQFTPGYFYLLALFYKILGTSVLTGRILTLIICLGIIYLTLKLFDKYKLNLRLKILAFLSVLAFGFPLINNMSLLAWPIVFLVLLIVLFFIEKRYVFLGIALSLILFTKQNIGIYFFLLTNLFLIISKTKLKNIVITNATFFLLTLIWFSYFFLILNSLGHFLELLSFNGRYLSVYRFSYPPLSMIFQPTGVFKLLPYYGPIVFLLFLVKDFFNKNRDINLLYFSSIAVLGFFGTVYPTSDLLHVYPFLGIMIVSSIIFFNNKTFSPTTRTIFLFIIGVLIASGFVLTLLGNYYRYQPPYYYQRTKLELPRAKNIYVDQPLALQLSNLNLFFLINTKKSDPILCYPFCPMMYFLLERSNPTRFANYYPGYLTKEEENEVIKDIKDRNVKFIITFLSYKFNTPISKFIQKQKRVYEIGQFKVFEIK